MRRTSSSPTPLPPRAWVAPGRHQDACAAPQGPGEDVGHGQLKGPWGPGARSARGREPGAASPSRPRQGRPGDAGSDTLR
eukprot:2585056-Pyramimonas_sp.AAC.1